MKNYTRKTQKEILNSAFYYKAVSVKVIISAGEEALGNWAVFEL